MAKKINLLVKEKSIHWLVWVTFAILLVLASIFYLERTLIMDVSYQGFSLLIHDTFAIQVNRFGAAFVQAFPLLAARAGLPLNSVLWFYSLSFVIEPLLCVIILCWGLKTRKWVWLLFFSSPFWSVIPFIGCNRNYCRPRSCYYFFTGF